MITITLNLDLPLVDKENKDRKTRFVEMGTTLLRFVSNIKRPINNRLVKLSFRTVECHAAVENDVSRGQPRGIVVKLGMLRFGSQGFVGSDPGHRPTPLIKPCCGGNPHTK